MFCYCLLGFTSEFKIILDFKVKLLGCLHHVVDEHDWGLGQCDHGDIPDDDTRPAYLVKDSPPHQALRSILMEPTWLKNAGEKCRNFRYDFISNRQH